ncbi:MAG: hypothetical protein EAX96_17445 [Candidatus Lokiarchaeota archaeon]|nr:hypothetical protein [Candidatus Lokiarchaeota archaeon]
MSRRAKIIFVALVAAALIFTIFGIVILAQVYTYDNYPTGLKNGDSFVYSYVSRYEGSLIGSTYIISDGLLTASVLSITTNFVNLSLTNAFHFNGSFNSTTTFMLVSTQQVNFPFFYQRDDAAARFPISSYISSQPTGNYFGWSSNPRNYQAGYFVGAGDWYINSKTFVVVPYGVFGVYKLINHQYQTIANIQYENMTTIYVEQLTGVIVMSEYYSNIRNMTSGTDLYKESETLKLVQLTTYTFPILSGIVIFLNFGDPIITFLTVYLIIIVLIITVIIVVYLWKRTSAYRRD